MTKPVQFKRGEKDYFDKQAKFSKSTEVTSKFFQEFLKFLAKEKTSYLILDFGCGEGIYSRAIASEKNDAHIIGVDLSRFCIKNAMEKTPVGDKHKLSFLVCDCEKLPFRSEIFDAIVFTSILHHLPSLATLGRISNTVKKGGYLFLDEPSNLNNPLMLLSTKMFPLLPIEVRASLVGSTIDSPLVDNPQRIAFTAGTLRRSLIGLGYELIREERGQIFGFLIDYTFRAFPWFRHLISSSVESSLRQLESLLINRTPFRIFCSSIRLWCRKNNKYAFG
ncbi:MAG: class I SAM-dependent methyltransferase [Candidatus Altiarchaeota archaeon]